MIRWRWIGDSLDGATTLVVHGGLGEAVKATGKNWVGVGVGGVQDFVISDREVCVLKEDPNADNLRG